MKKPCKNPTRLVLTARLFLSLFLLSVPTAAACSDGHCQLREHCSSTADCGSGLYCGNCSSLNQTQPFCIRDQATIPTSIIGELPFNKYSWLVTHNAFSIAGEPSTTGGRVTFYNQEDSVTDQLKNGVRGLMLDMYDFEDDVWLCHSFGGHCYNITAFEPAINTLKEVETFLSQHPSEIVTIIIEDYVNSTARLRKVFDDAGLGKYWFPVTKMPKNGKHWPRVDHMVHDNHRLLVFTSNSSKEREGIAYQWNYILENESGDPGVKLGMCPNRKESKPLNSRNASLILMNYFPTFPDQSEACKVNSAPLANMVETCYKSAGNLMPNFLAVNFYRRSDGGGVFADLDRMNGHTLCGCSTVAACQAGAPNGSCKAVVASNTATPIAANTTNGSFSGSVQLPGDAPLISIRDGILLFVFLILL